MFTLIHFTDKEPQNAVNEMQSFAFLGNNTKQSMYEVDLLE